MKVLKTVAVALAATVLFGLTAVLLWQAIRLVMIVQQMVEALPGVLRTELQETRRMLDDRLASVEVTLDGRLASVESHLLAEVQAARRDANRHLLSVGAMVDDHLTTAQLQLLGAVQKADRQLAVANLGWAILVKNASDVLKPTAATMRVVEENAELLGNCTGNPDCLPNRAIGTMRAMETSARAVAKAAPETAEAVRSASQSAARIAASWERKLPLYARVLAAAARPAVWLAGVLR